MYTHTGIYLLSNYEDQSDIFAQGHLTTSSSASRLSGGDFKFHSSFRTTETILSNLIASSTAGGTAGSGTGSSSNVVVSSSHNNSNFGHGVGLTSSTPPSATTSVSPYHHVERGNSSGCIELGGGTVPQSPTPQMQRRLAKSFSVAPAITQTAKGYSTFFPFLFLSLSLRV